MQDQENASVNRRRLLRRAGSVAAGVAGAGVITAVAGSPAQAAPGGQVLMAPGNDAGGNNTSITSSSTAATLSLANTNSDAAGWAHASLQLVPTTKALSDEAPVGSLGVDSNGYLWTNVKYSDNTHGAEWVYTTHNSNKTVLLDTPQRALDTRGPGGRVHVLNPGVLDGEGRLIGNNTIELDLGAYAIFADAVLATVAVLAPTAPGYASVYGLDFPAPATATIGFNAGQSVNSYLASATNFRVNVTTTGLSIYLNTATAHVILDVWGFIVRSGGQVNQAANAANARAASPDAAAREAYKSREIAKLLKNK